MMTRLPLRLDDDLRRRLDKAASAKGLPVAEVIRQACDAYLTGLDSYWARQVDQAVNATASTLQPLAEKLDAIQQNVSETLARVEHTAQQHQGDLDRANDDQQLLIAMVNELALFVFGASTTPETPVTAAIARERHAKWADDI
ncbi:MAG: ribbon-helix-helix protein, CopG family, partial [Methanobacterium sp.]|nr:ribbon-helix-helix protein, CopG family [Methanobacterium sp.]